MLPRAARENIDADTQASFMAFLIDVRTAEEYLSEHAEGAVNIPLENIEAGRLGLLANVPKNSQIDLYCRTGHRSGEAREMLAKLGYTQVTNLGGLDDVL